GRSPRARDPPPACSWCVRGPPRPGRATSAPGRRPALPLFPPPPQPSCGAPDIAALGLLFDYGLTGFLLRKERARRGNPAGAGTSSKRDLHRDDVCSLRALLAVDDVELNLLAFLQAAEPFLLDGAVVDEDVLTAIHGDEAVALLRVEPLHRACNHCGLAPFLASYRYRHIRAVPVRTRISCDFSGVNPTPRRA